METQLPLFPGFQPTTPTVTWAEHRAARFIEGLHAAAAIVPELEAPHPATASKVRGGRTVPIEFIQTMIAVVQRTPEGQKLADTFDPDDAMAMLQFRAGFAQPVTTHVEGLLKAINYTAEAWKARVAARALATFAVLKALSRRNITPELESWMKTLTHHLGRRGTKKKRRRT